MPSSSSTGQTVENGTLYAVAGDSLSVTYTDPTCPGGTATDTANVTLPMATKPLYLDTDGTDSDTTGDLDRVDPVNVTPQDTSTSQTLVLGSAGTVTGVTYGGTAMTLV